MVPKTEKELELLFKLIDLIEARKNRHKKIYQSSPGGQNEVRMDYHEDFYQRIKSEYLILVND